MDNFEIIEGIRKNTERIEQIVDRTYLHLFSDGFDCPSQEQLLDVVRKIIVIKIMLDVLIER